MQSGLDFHGHAELQLRRKFEWIVEDERIVAKDLQYMLGTLGYDAFAIAASSDEAVARTAERCPDLVLMDIRIKGGRDGIETAALLRRRFAVPVVYLTAHSDDVTLERAKQTSPYGYLRKPVKPTELRSAIEISIHCHAMGEAAAPALVRGRAALDRRRGDHGRFRRPDRVREPGPRSA